MISDVVGKLEALKSLRPGARYAITGMAEEEQTVEWMDTEQTCPTEEEIQAEIVRLQAEYDAKAYQRNRKPEYPDIGDQLDDLFKAGAFSTEMAAKIQAVKDKYPKDNT